jgi:DNA polymerase delta subunit 3
VVSNQALELWLLLILDRMLFDFHQKQNVKKANSIHATYLISGTKRSVDDTNGTNGQKGGNVSMRSSPFMSSMPEQEVIEPEEEPVKQSTLLLVREEELASTDTARIT